MKIPVSALRTAVVLGAVLNFVTPACAINLVMNGSFETATGISPNDTLAPGATNLDGWTVIGGGNLIWCDSSSYCNRSPSDGIFSLDLTGLTNAAPYAGVQQAIATVPGTAYILTFDLTGRSDSLPVSVQASAGTATAPFANPSATWLTQTLPFIATAASTTISVVGTSSGGTGLDIQIDNVQVTAVPEPSTLAMLAAGIGVLLSTTRRRRSQHQSSKASQRPMTV